MPKIYSNTSQVQNINKNILSYLKGKKVLPQNAQVKHIWAENNQTNIPSKIYAGQIEYEKILANGNKQTRLVTAYGDGSIATTTTVESPSGELLKAYTGLRDRTWKATNPETGNIVKQNTGTPCYASGTRDEVITKANKFYGSNPPSDRNNLYLLMR